MNCLKKEADMEIVKVVCRDEQHVPDVEFMLNRCSLKNIHLGTAVIFEAKNDNLIKMVEYIGKARTERPSNYDLQEFSSSY